MVIPARCAPVGNAGQGMNYIKYGVPSNRGESEADTNGGNRAPIELFRAGVRSWDVPVRTLLERRVVLRVVRWGERSLRIPKPQGSSAFPNPKTLPDGFADLRRGRKHSASILAWLGVAAIAARINAVPIMVRGIGTPLSVAKS